MGGVHVKQSLPLTTTTIVITGLGAVTPLGRDAKSTWAAMLSGECGVRALTEPWAPELPVRFAARAAGEPAESLSRIEVRRLDRAAQFALLAVREAWADAGFVGSAGGGHPPFADRTGVAIGCGMGGLDTLLANYQTMLSRGGRMVSPRTISMTMPNSAAGQASIEIGALAGVHAPVSACATGTEAIALGLDMIRAGRADVVAVGGTEAIIHPFAINAFANMHAMSRHNDDPQRASRPYDRKRDGFVMGEGAGVLILESAEHASARGDRVYCQLAGAGYGGDAHHMTAPPPDGAGMVRAMRHALADSGLCHQDVVHVNAHATSTPLGDLAESRAIRVVLGDGGYCVSATKSMTGHLIGAAGAVGAVATALAIHDRLAPPTINIDDLDAEIGLDVVRDEPRPLPAGPMAALTNSSGFGGHNVVLAFRAHG